MLKVDLICLQEQLNTNGRLRRSRTKNCNLHLNHQDYSLQNTTSNLKPPEPRYQIHGCKLYRFIQNTDNQKPSCLFSLPNTKSLGGVYVR